VSDELSPLPPKLRELLQKEREESIPVPRAAEERLLTMLRAASPVAPPPSHGDAAKDLADAGKAPTGHGSSAWLAPKSLILATATGVLGFVGGLTVSPAPVPRGPESQEVSPREHEPLPSSEPDAAAERPDAGTQAVSPPVPAQTRPPEKPQKRLPKPAPEPEAEAPGEPPPSVPEEPRERASEPSAEAPDVQHASERQLIDAARVALGRGRSHDALVFLMGHERRFSDGMFAEERELLVIEALIAQNRVAQARERGKAFLAKYPRSAHAPRVRTLIGTP
jgi:hypothetical protein